MGKRQAIKNIKRVSCRFDMDVPEERRAWQILQGNYQEPPDGKKQDYYRFAESFLPKFEKNCRLLSPHAEKKELIKRRYSCTLPARFLAVS